MSKHGKTISVNVHLPWWFRRGGYQNNTHTGSLFFKALIDFLMNEGNIDLTVSAKSYRPREFPQETYCINYHKKFDLRRNLNVKLAYFHSYFYFDRKGYSGWSEIANSAFNPEDVNEKDAAQYFDERIRSAYLDRGISKYQQPSVTPELPENFVFFPMQVPNDSVLNLSYIQQTEILLELMRDPIVPVVIKVHPITQKRHPEAAKSILDLHDPKKSVFVVDGHLHDIIRRSKAVICINSGAGMEALLLGRPVLTCGRSEYHHLTKVVKNASEIWPAIESAEAVSEDVMKKYALWFFGQNLVDIRDPPSKWARDILDRLLATG